MFKLNGFAALMLLCSLAACDASGDKKPAAVDEKQVEQAIDSADSAQSNPDSSVDQVAASSLPSAQVVLNDIFKQPLTGQMDQTLQDGRMASYWAGHQFSFKGKTYQVGFATSVEAATEFADEFPAPEEQVSVSSATYELADNASKLVNSQDKFAKFGAKAQAATVRTNAKLETFEVGDTLLLAVPVRTLEMGGVELQSSELFSFNSTKNSWSYVGNIYTGQNDDANCVDGKTPNDFPCSSHTGSIAIAEKSGSAFPDIRVTRSGSEVGADKKVRSLSDKDFFEYKYNVEKSRYEQLQK